MNLPVHLSCLSHSHSVLKLVMEDRQGRQSVLFNAAILVAALSSSQDVLSGARGDRRLHCAAPSRALRRRGLCQCVLPAWSQSLAQEHLCCKVKGRKDVGERERQAARNVWPLCVLRLLSGQVTSFHCPGCRCSLWTRLQCRAGSKTAHLSPTLGNGNMLEGSSSTSSSEDP